VVAAHGDGYGYHGLEELHGDLLLGLVYVLDPGLLSLEGAGDELDDVALHYARHQGLGGQEVLDLLHVDVARLSADDAADLLDALEQFLQGIGVGGLDEYVAAHWLWAQDGEQLCALPDGLVLDGVGDDALVADGGLDGVDGVVVDRLVRVEGYLVGELHRFGVRIGCGLEGVGHILGHLWIEIVQTRLLTLWLFFVLEAHGDLPLHSITFGFH
jgi:hypothetical protein